MKTGPQPRFSKTGPAGPVSNRVEAFAQSLLPIPNRASRDWNTLYRLR